MGGIEIGGYVFYPSFWIAVVVVPAIIVLVVILLINFKFKKKEKSYNSITSWQRNKIDELLDDEMEDMEDADDEYKDIVRNIQGYVRRRKFWDVDELLEIDDDAVIVLSSIVYDEIVRDVRKNKFNDAVLLLHAFDYINGGVHFIGNQMDWIGDEVEEYKNDLKMSDYEARLLKIFCSSIDMMCEKIDYDIDKIPETVDVDPMLKTYSAVDFEKASDEIFSCIDMRNLGKETLDITARCLTEHMRWIINETTKKVIPEWQLYYIRALACALDKQLYPDILNSIDFE